MSWTDDFERADGGLGANWSTVSGNPEISGGRAVAPSSNAIAYTSAVSHSGRHDASLNGHYINADSWQVGIYFKLDPATGNAYLAAGQEYSGNVYIQLYKVTAWTQVALGQTNCGSNPASDFTMTATYDAGEISVSLVGLGTFTYSDSSYDSGTHVGMFIRANNGSVDAISADLGPAASMQVTPDPLWVGGGAVDVVATGTGTTWTTGVPGSSTLSVDHGTISDQRTVSATEIRATYTPDEYVGTLTFTESEGGLQDQVTATLVPPEGGLCGQCKLTDPGADLVNRTGDADATGLILTTELPIGPTGDEQPINNIFDFVYRYLKLTHGSSDPTDNSSDVLYKLWQIANGLSEPDPGTNILGQATGAYNNTVGLIAILNTLTASQTIDLQDVLDAIASLSPVTLAQLRLALGLTDYPQYTSVIHAIEALYGPQRPTLTDIAQLIQELSTIAGYNLSDVKAWIEALSSGISVDLTPVLDRLDDIQPNPAYDLTSVTSLLVNLTGTANSISNSLTALRTPNSYTLQTVLDAIAQLRHDIQLDLTTLRLPPIWPGLAHVTLGPVADLATTTLIEGPMHGVVVQITATEPGTSYFRYDGVTAWRHVGGLAFYGDGGQSETHQALGFGEAIYVPKTLAVAQGVRFYKSHLPRGTVRPWTITP